MLTGTYWTVRFCNGETGSKYATKQEVANHAYVANRHFEKHSQERAVCGLVRFINYKQKQEIPL